MSNILIAVIVLLFVIVAVLPIVPNENCSAVDSSNKVLGITISQNQQTTCNNEHISILQYIVKMLDDKNS